EVSGPVVAIAIILASVFVPTAFIPGITGRLYQQFALTIAISVIISAFNALSLSPAMCALLLRPKDGDKGALGAFHRWFDRMFARVQGGYVDYSRLLIRRKAVSFAVLGCFAAAAFLLASRLPRAFLPEEDQGYYYVRLQLPNASSLQRTEEVARKVEAVLKDTPGVSVYTSVIGFNLLSTSYNTYSAFFFVSFKPWAERTRPEERIDGIRAHLARELSKIPEANAVGFPPPSIPGVGTAGGFIFVLEDRAGRDIPFLDGNVRRFLDEARKRKEIAPGISTTFLPNVPQLFIRVDRDKVMKQGVPLSDVYRTLQTFMGGYFVNFFNRFGRQWQVYVEAEGEYRDRPDRLGSYFVRNRDGAMVPLSALTTVEHRLGPEFTMRYNLYRSAQINGSAAPGYSSDQATRALEEVFAQTMPREMGFDYIGMSFQEKKAREGVPPFAIFGLSLLFVFLILAALYESWSLPFSVLLGVPVALFGAYAALWARQMEINVFAQIGMIMLIGLSAKNAILIVEFARTRYEHGVPLMDAALQGAKIRLRPILMTSFAFIFGCLPLWFATGSGAVARRVMGTAVIGGMVAASALAIFLIPVTFYAIEMWVTKGEPHSAHTARLAAEAAAAAQARGQSGEHPAPPGTH
ncbi:MAG TPA: efflux RND transporter permease subunit, partial [Opitutaceae bacterium]|nr:efflux RND transporter permease subunit [Opitutaceae bacterium]